MHHLSAQPLTTSANAPRTGDVLRMQQTEYVNTGDGGEDRVWDLSGIEVVNPRHRVRVLAKRDSADAAADTVMTIENRMRRYTLLRDDSLLSTGTESTLSLVRYEQPELSLHFPVNYGDSVRSVFYGTASWCEHAYSRAYGESRVKADATGTLVTPDGDTLTHVLRIHTRRITGASLLPTVTEPAMRAYLDSMPAFTADSAEACLALDAGRRMVTREDIHRFYAMGYRYPVFETRRTATPDGTVSEEAYYFPVEEQLALPADEENERIRNGLMAADDRRNADDGRNGGSGTDTPPSPLSRCDVTVNGSVVTVTYDLTEAATVRGMVCTVGGMVLRQGTQHNDAGTGYQMQISCTGLRRGQYVLYMEANGLTTGYTVSLQ